MTPRRAKSDLDLLQGTWNVAALEMDGSRMSAAISWLSLSLAAKHNGRIHRIQIYPCFHTTKHLKDDRLSASL
jgi:hypothetical protein